MIPGTHLLISNILYEHILMKTKLELDFGAFAYGNILPDFNKKYINCAHTIDDSFETISLYADEIIKGNSSIKEFSMALGVICHFICDYFCIYHSKDYWKKDMVQHFIYEIILHTKLLMLLSNGDIRIKYNYKREKSIEALLMRIIKKYNLGKRSMKKDIIYAIAASASICELIINTSEIYKENKKAAFSKGI